MVEIKKKNNFIDSTKRKGREFNGQTKPGKLSKDGLIYKNNYLDTDLTSGQTIKRKLRG